MPFAVRACISILAGVGAGLVGFASVWLTVERLLLQYPGVGYNAWLVPAIFAPGVLVAFASFWAMSRP